MYYLFLYDLLKEVTLKMSIQVRMILSQKVHFKANKLMYGLFLYDP